jgi:hypothetical protein
VVKVEVVLEDVGVGENGAKAEVIQKYFTPHSRTKF